MEKDYFDELVIECESDWRTFRKGRYASIWQGIVEKYSDQAHFVYELLQNADDAKATYARFKLYHNRLVFAHNGSKHFSVTNPLTEDEDRNNGCLGDVNAITSIGHSTKIEQNTIGKFGIGFKAVFQYTKAPRIYDQNIRFKIERYIVPSRLEQDHAERKPEETLFEFPFDHNINTAEIAFNAISQRLISLVNPLLFLSHLQEIRFEFDDTIGSYTKEIVKSYTFDDTTVEKIILKQTINKETKKIQLWLFSRTDENSGRYAVGFYMNDKGDLIPANDFAYCFFPTTVNTGLHFIIHAPFLLTDSREGIKKEDPHNQHMLDLLSDLAADSLSYMIDIGKAEKHRLLKDSILKVIPTKSLNETGFAGFVIQRSEFEPFYLKILKAFQTKPILPTKDSYTTSANAYWAKTSSISTVISNTILRELIRSTEASWAFPSASRDNYDDFIEEIFEDHIIDDQTVRSSIYPEFIEAREIIWLEKFYKWIDDSLTRRSQYRTVPIFLDSEGKAVAAFDNEGKHILFLPTDTESDYTTVNEELLKLESIASFLRSYEITKPSLKDEIYNKVFPLLNQAYQSNNIPKLKQLFRKLFTYYMECSAKGKESFLRDLKKYSFLICYHSATPSTKCIAKKNSYIYFPEVNLLDYFTVKPSTLFVDFASYLTIVGEENEKYLRSMLSELGVLSNVIITITPLSNPYSKYNYRWSASTRNDTWSESVIDGCAESIAYIVNNHDSERSFILWKIIVDIIRTNNHGISGYDIKDLDKYLWVRHKYYYRTDKKEFKYSIDVPKLRKEKWLLDKSGNLVSPSDVYVKDLSDEYDTTSYAAKLLINFLKMTYEDPKLSGLTPEQRKAVEISQLLQSCGYESEEDVKHLIAIAEKEKQKEHSIRQEEFNPNTTHSDIHKSESSHEYDENAPAKPRKQRTYTPEPIDDDDSDEYTPKPIDYKQKINNARAKSEAEIDFIEQMEELQQKALDATRYSFGWFKALLELEIKASGEGTENAPEISITFGKVELDTANSNGRTLILKYPDRGIPRFMEELADLPLVLEFEKEPVKLPIENISIRSYTLRVRIKPDMDISYIPFNEVKAARITAQNPVFLLDELKKQLSALPFEDDFDMQKNLCSNIEFIFGPPGTGKTTYLANEVIIPMMKQNDRCRVLVLTPTNKAADVIAEKIMEMMGDDTSYKEWLVRFGTTNAPTIVDSGILRDKTFDLRSLSSIVTVTTIDRYPYDYWMTDDSRHYLRNQNYDYIIFDEASMIPLFKMIYPLYHREPKKFIIAGDPFQIEPVIRLNMWEGENIYKMVRLNSFSSPKTRPYPYNVKLLTTQYRSIPLIGELFSKMTYDGILKHHRKQEEQVTIDFGDLTDVRPLNLIKFPVSKYESVYRTKRLGTSPYQIYSALFAYEFTSWIQNMISSHNPDKKVRIGVIAAYKAQADLIQRLIATNPKSDIVEIQADTIHGFQGDECEIIIAVYNPPPGMSDSDKNFLNKKNIINVSISRARDYLFILMPDDDTEKVDNLRLIKRMEHYIKDTDQYTEYSSHTIEQMMFGKPDYLEENSFSTAHQNVNVYGLPEQIYEIRSEESAIDIQIKK